MSTTVETTSYDWSDLYVLGLELGLGADVEAETVEDEIENRVNAAEQFADSAWITLQANTDEDFEFLDEGEPTPETDEALTAE